MYTLGIDIGSTTSKAVILKDGTEIVAASIVVATVGTDGVSQALDNVMKESGLTQADMACTVATGYGRQTRSASLPATRWAFILYVRAQEPSLISADRTQRSFP